MKRKLKHFVLIATLIVSILVFQPRNAQATCCCSELAECEVCLAVSEATVKAMWPITIQLVNLHTKMEFIAHRQWYVATLWEDNLLPALMMMADQLAAIANLQTTTIGEFLDAKHQLETQRVLQTVRARAHKDYHPSDGVCEFGTTVRSLAASERRSELNAHVMSQRSQDRALGSTNVAASSGPDADFRNRLEQYKKTYCDPSDHNGALDLLCEGGASDPKRMNKDVDYARTVDYPWTLNIDFTDANSTSEEEDVLALAGNLYGDTVFKRIQPASLFNPENPNYEGVRSAYLDSRALLAKRSVAENSFNSIVSMKAAGTAGSRSFLQAILSELGSSNMLGSLSGNAAGPSYYAQMEVLTKKIYQNPDFYTNLYDKPANVERKQVAMQAIGLMQKFDLFKSYLRNEANLSVLLELALTDLQKPVEERLGSQKR